LYHIKNDKRTAVTTNLIQDALSTLILEGQWGCFTLTKLAERAQVGRATFYRSFDAIEDVLQLQVDQAMVDLFTFIMEKIKRLPSFFETDIYNLFFQYWNRHDRLLTLLLISDQQAMFKNQLMRLYRENLTFVQRILQIQESHWAYFVILRCSVLSDGLFEWIKNGKKESPEEISRILLLSFSELHAVELSLTKSVLAHSE